MRLQHVHDLGWEWRLSPTATPPLVHFRDRDYQRSELPPTANIGGLKASGHTPGGGTIYSSGSPTPLTIVVVDGDRRVWYGLMGGP